MSLDPESLYIHLGRLVASMPDLRGPGPITPEINQWLGRAVALVEASGANGADIAFLKVATQGLDTVLRDQNAQAIAAIVYSALARAEMNAPASAQGAFIAAGDALNAFAAVAKVLARAKNDLMLVDGYADPTILTDYAVTAPEGVQLRILTANKESRKLALRPAVERWGKQFGADRPIAVRVAPAASLHDRLILVDGAEAWSPGQSFNAMAERSHTSIVKSDPELSAMKVQAYEAMWQNADPL